MRDCRPLADGHARGDAERSCHIEADRQHRRKFSDDVREATDTGDAIDAIIRRKFRDCPTLPLFPEPRARGFFEIADIGRQLRLLDASPPGGPHGRT